MLGARVVDESLFRGGLRPTPGGAAARAFGRVRGCLAPMPAPAALLARRRRRGPAAGRRRGAAAARLRRLATVLAHGQLLLGQT
ncbi:hypothetical protein SXIM_26640 [Streptomyces xiamenensis]|uniref:Uncharacterized protein n=1 Tax=Streptomyces xiamenensis TaxID=408015 RepID=A0A0F7FV47_9ACTN|nr:hypothetical protein SXIM_26640 [Streptomyces xiamenensis]